MYDEIYEKVLKIINEYPVEKWPEKLTEYFKTVEGSSDLFLAFFHVLLSQESRLGDDSDVLLNLIPTVLRYGDGTPEEYCDALAMIYPVFFHYSEKEKLTFINGLLLSVVRYLDAGYGKARYDALMETLLDTAELGVLGKEIAFGVCTLIENNYSSRPALMESMKNLLDHLETENPDNLDLNELVEAFFRDPDHSYFTGILKKLMEEEVFVPVNSPMIRPRKKDVWKYPAPGLLYTTDDSIYIPIFTAPEKADPSFLKDMGYELTRMPFTEVLKRSRQDPAFDYEVVLNPFSEPMNLQKKILDELAKIKEETSPNLHVVESEKDNVTVFPGLPLEQQMTPQTPANEGDNVIDLDKYR